jgi:hypothetical protein
MHPDMPKVNRDINIKKTLTALLLMGIDRALQYKMNNVWLALIQKGLFREMHYYSIVLCRGKSFPKRKL